MATTESQLIGYVLDNFAATGSGQAANADDAAKVQPYLAGVIADLAETGTYYIADSESVPDAAVHWVAAIVAHAPGLRRHFGEPENLPSLEYCEGRLRRLGPPREFPTLAVDYF